jgi:hypothetical protein
MAPDMRRGPVAGGRRGKAGHPISGQQARMILPLS